MPPHGRFTLRRVFFLGLPLLCLTSLGASALHTLPPSVPAVADDPMEVLLVRLNGIDLGKKLIQKAFQTWKVDSLTALSQQIHWDAVSRTDTVLTRHYEPSTRRESHEREVTIYLKKNQSQTDALLDLVHELVHATSRPAFDPYDATLTPGKYVWAALEGEGGEVEAVMSECQVGAEIAQQQHFLLARCSSYLGHHATTHSESELRAQVRQDFYKVGSWYPKLVASFGEEASLFPYLSAHSPRFFSSTGRTPYPESLLREFQEMTRVACQNSQRRSRRMASLEQAHFLDKRCQSTSQGL